MCSKDLFKIFFLVFKSDSLSTDLYQIFKDFGNIEMAFANKDLAILGGSNLAASIHKSSLNSQNFKP